MYIPNMFAAVGSSNTGRLESTTKVHLSCFPSIARRHAIVLLVLVGGAFLSACERPQKLSESAPPDTRHRAVADDAAVSSAHPLASDVGRQIMQEKGGNAVDAAVATAFALGVVEPQMSGLGGGGSMLIWRDDQGEADYGNFYAAKRAKTYRGLDYDAVDDENLLETAIPGMTAGLLDALERHGTLDRETVMAPAIRLAEEGVPVYQSLRDAIRSNTEKLRRYDTAQQRFFPNGEPLELGEILRQPRLAETLRKISEEGRSAFYEGPLAENMVEVLNEGDNPVSLADFSNYEPQWDVSPLCGTYRGQTVLTAPPPQTGIKQIQAFNLMEAYEPTELGVPPRSSEAFHTFASIMRLGMADRGAFISDPNWETVPVEGMRSEAYAAERRRWVDTTTVPEEMPAGEPTAHMESTRTPGCQAFPAYDSPDPEKVLAAGRDNGSVPGSVIKDDGSSSHSESSASVTGNTTHLSIVDPAGNAVALSATLSPMFGAGASVNGYILNASGYDFSEMDEADWEQGQHPYRVRASTISPTILLKDRNVQVVVGAPGGLRIPTAVFQNLVYIVDYDMDPLEALRMPRVFPSVSSPDVQVERTFDESVLRRAREIGYEVHPRGDGYARLYVIVRQGDDWVGAADPRHDGAVRGF